jgi:thymidylate kinase
MTLFRGVIVEGSDCSGKTTLVKRLKADLSIAGWDVLYMGHKPGDQFKRYMRTYLEADGLLFDRGHFSEVVYGDSWRGGRHFAEWERTLLDDVVRENFIVVLCTAPATLLRERYYARDYAQSGSAQELETLQNRFLDTVAPVATIVYESTSVDLLERAVRDVLDRLPRTSCGGGLPKAPLHRQTQCPDFILLEGANGSGKSTFAELLKVNLVGWHIRTLDYDPTRQPFKRFLADYLAADRAILDRGHFSEIVYGDMFREGKHFTADQLTHLCRYVESRGLVVLCEASLSTLCSRASRAGYPKHINPDRLDEVATRFRQALDASKVPYHRVFTDDASGVAQMTDRIVNQIGGTPYAGMGWDR